MFSSWSLVWVSALRQNRQRLRRNLGGLRLPLRHLHILARVGRIFLVILTRQKQFLAPPSFGFLLQPRLGRLLAATSIITSHLEPGYPSDKQSSILASAIGRSSVKARSNANVSPSLFLFCPSGSRGNYHSRRVHGSPAYSSLSVIVTQHIRALTIG